jgi:hypothetical protein
VGKMNESHLKPLICQLLKIILGDVMISSKALSWICSAFANSLISLGIQCKNSALASGRSFVNLADVVNELDFSVVEIFEFQTNLTSRPLNFIIQDPVPPVFKPISIRTYKNLPSYWEKHLPSFPSEHTFRATEMSFTPDPFYLKVIKKRTSQSRQVEENLKRLIPLKVLPSKIKKLVKSDIPLVPRRDLCIINYTNQYIKGQKRELDDELDDEDAMMD